MFYLMNNDRNTNPFFTSMDMNATKLEPPTQKKARPLVIDVLAAATQNTCTIEEMKRCHIGEILAVMLNCALLSPRGNDGVQRIITFLTQQRCPDLRLGDRGETNRLWFYAKTRLEIQFPELTKLKDELEKTKEAARKMRNGDAFIKSWALKQGKIHGVYHFVRTTI